MSRPNTFSCRFSRRYQTASLPSSSTASRTLYFRSSETAKACLCELSSSVSSRQTPSAGQTLSRWRSAATARSVAAERRPKISARSKPSVRF